MAEYSQTVSRFYKEYCRLPLPLCQDELVWLQSGALVTRKTAQTEDFRTRRRVSSCKPAPSHYNRWTRRSQNICLEQLSKQVHVS